MQRISIDDMTLENIEEVDIKSVKKLARATERKHILLFSLFLIASISLLSDFKNKLTLSNIEDIFLAPICFIIAFSLCIYNLKRLLMFSNKSISDLSICKKAQYGILCKKHFNKPSGLKSGKTSYYLKISFPKQNTYIDCVRCSEKLYKKVSNRDTILLVSFDNKTLGVIASNISKV